MDSLLRLNMLWLTLNVSTILIPQHLSYLQRQSQADGQIPIVIAKCHPSANIRLEKNNKLKENRDEKA